MVTTYRNVAFHGTNSAFAVSGTASCKDLKAGIGCNITFTDNGTASTGTVVEGFIYGDGTNKLPVKLTLITPKVENNMFTRAYHEVMGK